MNLRLLKSSFGYKGDETKSISKENGKGMSFRREQLDITFFYMWFLSIQKYIIITRSHGHKKLAIIWWFGVVVIYDF